MDANVALRPARRTAAAHRGLHARTGSSGPSPPASSARRTVIALQGAGEEGRGEDVTYEAGRPRRPAAGRPGARARGRVDVRLVLRAPRRARHLPGLHARAGRLPPLPALGASSRRRWTSRCARPARRCTSCSAATAEPVTFVVSSRMGDPPTLDPVARRLARLPDAALQARRHAGLDRRADRAAAGDAAPWTRSTSRAPTRAPSSTSRPTRTFYRRIAEAFPDAWLEDPDLETDEARRALAAAPGPDHLGRADPRRRGHPRRAR